MKNKLKRRKWYSAKIKPDCEWDLIVMTDMGYIFEATYRGNLWYLSVVNNHKVSFPVYESQESIIKWMKV